CQYERGFTCVTPGSPCTKDEGCGDSVVQASRGEKCDDGNSVPGDGCSGNCTIESSYACPLAGMPCELTCGNGKVNTGEKCDDGNRVSGDGCPDDCSEAEPGFTCPQ